MKHTLIAAAVALMALTGCCSPRAVSSSPPLIYGERIFIRNAGDVVVLPELKEPARVWYIVDDVGLIQWLGLSDPNSVETAARKRKD